jgi:hypothetical protein
MSIGARSAATSLMMSHRSRVIATVTVRMRLIGLYAFLKAGRALAIGA